MIDWAELIAGLILGTVLTLALCLLLHLAGF